MMVKGGKCLDMMAARRSSLIVRTMKLEAIELTRPTLGKPMMAMPSLRSTSPYSWMNISPSLIGFTRVKR